MKATVEVVDGLGTGDQCDRRKGGGDSVLLSLSLSFPLPLSLSVRAYIRRGSHQNTIEKSKVLSKI